MTTCWRMNSRKKWVRRWTPRYSETMLRSSTKKKVSRIRTLPSRRGSIKWRRCSRTLSTHRSCRLLSSPRWASKRYKRLKKGSRARSTDQMSRPLGFLKRFRSLRSRSHISWRRLKKLMKCLGIRLWKLRKTWSQAMKVKRRRSSRKYTDSRFRSRKCLPPYFNRRPKSHRWRVRNRIARLSHPCWKN